MLKLVSFWDSVLSSCHLCNVFSTSTVSSALYFRKFLSSPHALSAVNTTCYCLLTSLLFYIVLFHVSEWNWNYIPITQYYSFPFNIYLSKTVCTRKETVKSCMPWEAINMTWQIIKTLFNEPFAVKELTGQLVININIMSWEIQTD
jgi:hypothetical protein